MKRHLKDFFIPHEGNDYAPHSLQKIAVFCMGILILLSFTFANVHSIIWITSDWMVSTILPSVIVDLTNEERSSYDVVDLERNATLDFAARLKAQHMAQNQYFSHYAPDGTSPWHWFSVAEYAFVHAGENLAIHFSDSDAVVDAWMNSPTHKANIINGNFTEIGVGTAQGVYEGYQTVYVVQLFGDPARQQIAGAVETSEPATPVVAEEVIVETETVVEDTVPVIAAAEEIVEFIENDEVVLSSERDPIDVITELPEEVPESNVAIEDVIAHDDGVSVYSGTIATSSGAAPAIVNPVDRDLTREDTSPVYTLATQPQTVLQILYGVIALFVIGILLVSVLVEIRRQKPVQIAYSAALMGIMAVLLYAHTLITQSVTIV